MHLLNHPRAQTVPVVLLALGSLLASCAMNPNSEAYTQMLAASGNPVGVQTGYLTVVAYDSADGLPLMNATVDIVSAEGSIHEPTYFRKVGRSDWRGAATFNEVPRWVNISITHPRGSYARDDYAVPQGQTTEFRVYVDTLGPRTPDECRQFQFCGR